MCDITLAEFAMRYDLLNKYHSKNQCPDTDNQFPEENREDESILSSQPEIDSN